MHKPIKELGQNFLVDSLIARNMVDALEVHRGEDVLEIGPGHGILTQILVDKTRELKSRLFAVEIDERLCVSLEQMFKKYLDVTVVCKNILDYLPQFNTDCNFKILGSLPYYITSPIIHKIIKMRVAPVACVLLVQKEVAEKITSQAPDASYLSSFVQAFFDVEFLSKVPSKMFLPQPDVDGGIIRLIKKTQVFGSQFIEKYEGFLHKAFAHPRKMINKVFTREELEKGGIEADIRPQNLDSQEWLDFFHVLHQDVSYEL
jgi:16S rRNA (adenine1518-N6/adenine1519-N6)-dimethyltransferase